MKKMNIEIPVSIFEFLGMNCVDRASGVSQASFYIRDYHMKHDVCAEAGDKAIIIDHLDNDIWMVDVESDSTGVYVFVSDLDYVREKHGKKKPECSGAYTHDWINWKIYVFDSEGTFYWRFIKRFIKEEKNV